MVADGARGAILVWYTDANNLTVRGQRLDHNGTRLWGADGVEIGQVTGAGVGTVLSSLQLVEDAAGGAFRLGCAESPRYF